MCFIHFIFGSLARSQIKDYKMKRKYILGKWVKFKSVYVTPAGGSNVPSHKVCPTRTGECRKLLFLCLGLLSCWERSLFLWNVKINVWHSSCLRGQTRTEKVPFTSKTLQGHIVSQQNTFLPTFIYLVIHLFVFCAGYFSTVVLTYHF